MLTQGPTDSSMKAICLQALAPSPSSGGGLYTATVDYGDGSGLQPLSLSSEYLFDLSHQYLENGVYTIVVTIFKDGVRFYI